MEKEVIRVFTAVAICFGLSLVLASDGTNGLGINMEIEESSHSSSSDSCCSSHYSKVYQSDQVVANEDREFSVGDEVLNSSSIALSVSAKCMENITCTATWLRPKPSSNCTSCECGSSLGGLVECDSNLKKVDLLRCYCMTFSIDGSLLVVGPCPYACIIENGIYSRYPLSSNASKLDELCSRYNREGQLCGRCKDGFALPVYSYNISCVSCESHYTTNWVKYVAASLFPLTLLFIVIVVFRIRVTSGIMNAFVLVCQTVSLPLLSRILMLSLEYHYGYGSSVYTLTAVFISFHGIWNLDFFRPLYSPFCLYPETSTVQILALNYVIAVYPLVLLVVTYLLVKLHDSHINLIVWLWRPFHRCFVHFRRDWNIKTSLIDAFATFLLLSYMKFLSVSFDLLSPVRIFNIYGKSSKLYLYWDGTIEYFGSEHLPYAILALVVLMLFNVLPLLLMCLYPCRWFQRCLNHCRLQSHFLHTFMDAFQGCYKDGTNGSRDCRWFAGLYLFTRIVFLVMFVVTTSKFCVPLIGWIILIFLLLTALLRPYKAHSQNHVNIFFLSMILFVIISDMANIIADEGAVLFRGATNFVAVLSAAIPLIYIIGVIIYKLFGHRMCARKLCRKLCRACMKRSAEDFERNLPERMVNVEECAALLADPMQVSGLGEEIEK